MCFHSSRLHGDTVLFFLSRALCTLVQAYQSPFSCYRISSLPPEGTESHNIAPTVRIQSHISPGYLFTPLDRWSFKYLLHACSLIIVKLQILGSLWYPWRVKLCRVLVHKVCVFGSTAATKVLHLHHLWQDGLVKVVLQSCRREVSLVQVIILILQTNAISTVKKRHDIQLCHSSHGYLPACCHRGPDLIPAQSMPNLW